MSDPTSTSSSVVGVVVGVAVGVGSGVDGAGSEGDSVGVGSVVESELGGLDGALPADPPFDGWFGVSSGVGDGGLVVGTAVSDPTVVAIPSGVTVGVRVCSATVDVSETTAGVVVDGVCSVLGGPVVSLHPAIAALSATETKISRRVGI